MIKNVEPEFFFLLLLDLGLINGVIPQISRLIGRDKNNGEKTIKWMPYNHVFDRTDLTE